MVLIPGKRLMHKVLIVAKCNVNDWFKLCIYSLTFVLIVAKCNVNEEIEENLHLVSAY